MTNGTGIRYTLLKSADSVFTSNNTPAAVGLNVPIAAGQQMRVRWWIPITVGATGGVGIFFGPAAGQVTTLRTIRINNCVANTFTANVASGAPITIGNALANAGNHFIEIEVYAQQGTTQAGIIQLLMAQNTSDPLSLTVLAGATAEVTVL